MTTLLDITRTTTLTAKELAERWHMAPGSLANMRCHGTGPAYLKLGTRVLYRIADIEAYEAERLVETVAA